MSKSVVTQEDQAEISHFSYLHMESAEKKSELKKANILLQNLQDAEDQLEEESLFLDDDDDDVAFKHYKVGNTFIHFDHDESKSQIEQEKETLNEKIDVLNQVITKYKVEMDSLKKVLYGKFGDNINLEENADE